MTTTDVVLLQAVREFPSVSVLMSTTPATRMTLTDATKLEDLIDQATLRLRRLDDIPDPLHLITTLNDLGRTLADHPTDSGVAIYVNAHTRRAVRLGVPVLDRVVIDTTFATRDLVLTLQRTPRHVVLVLDSRYARLLQSVNGTLQPALTSTFPLQAARERRSRPHRPHLGPSDNDDFLQTVAAGLRTYRAVHPSPLVVLGPAALVEAFLAQKPPPDRVAGIVNGHHTNAALAELTALTRPVLRRYLASREQEALELVHTRSGQGRVAAGMQAAWLSSRTEQPEMLAVEQSLFYPAQLSADGHHVQLSPDIDQPDVIDDAVDELIEHVLIRGGWVAFVDDNALASYGGIVLTRR